MGRIRLPLNIMVNNYLERDSLLEYFESKGIYWSSGKRATEFYPIDRYPYNINYGNYGYLTYGRKMRNSVSYSEFIKRRDTNYTFYRHKYDNYLIVSSYKGIGFRLGDIYLTLTNIWNIYDFRDFIPINENLIIRIGANNKNVIKRNIKNNNIIFGNIITGESVILDDISFQKLDNGLISELNDNWVDVDKVMIKQ